jgi:acyl-coenzyme A synthetase/AMP-(fatty) acid ligase
MRYIMATKSSTALVGDLGRWREDATLVIEGRTDTQIKLCGLRIDLAEIEHTIPEASNGVPYETAVSVCKPSSRKPKFLVAHFVFGHNNSVTPDTESSTVYAPCYYCSTG